MPKFKLSPAARADLKNIGQHTKEKWGINQRNRYLAGLDDRFQWLADNPMLGRSRDEVKEGYRSFNEGSHAIFYRVAGSDIEIVGIPHQSMDVEQHLSMEKNPKENP